MTFLTFKKAIGHAHALRDRSNAPLLHVLYMSVRLSIRVEVMLTFHMHTCSEKILYFFAITASRLALVYVLVSSQNVLLGVSTYGMSRGEAY
jgi:hypothetical protein